MPIRRTLGCSECGATWQHLFMNSEEAIPRCPNGCRKKVEEGLSAPALNRGAADTGIQIPQSQAGREKLAADLALAGTGMGDINSHMKAGDIAAKPLPTPVVKDVPNEMRAKLQAEITPRFLPVPLPPPTPGVPKDYTAAGQAIAATGAVDPAKRRNLGIMDSINKNPLIKPYSTIHRPTKRG